MSETTKTPAANSIESLQSAITSYKQQHEAQVGQLTKLETNYTQQHEQMKRTLDMLVGAVAALEQLIKNINDEAALNAARVVEVPAVPVPEVLEIPTDPTTVA